MPSFKDFKDFFTGSKIKAQPVAVPTAQDDIKARLAALAAQRAQTCIDAGDINHPSGEAVARLGRGGPPTQLQ